MARHRIVRSMNYEDECYEDEDDYSRSLEDNYCISPSTAAQFTWNRERNMNIASYMGVENVINEVEEEEAEEDSSLHDSLNDSASQARLKLSDTDQVRLNSCLDEIHTILGDAVPESVIIEAVLRNQFNIEKSLNELLTKQDTPKPQREPRNRRNRSQDDNDDTNKLNELLIEIQSLESLPQSECHIPELLRFKSNPGCEETHLAVDPMHLSESFKNVKARNENHNVATQSGVLVEKGPDRNTCSQDEQSCSTVLTSSAFSKIMSTKPPSSKEVKKASLSSSSPSLADLAKQSMISSNNKGLSSSPNGEPKLSLSDLSKQSKISLKESDGVGKVSLADLAKQHSKATEKEGSESKKMSGGGSGLSSVLTPQFFQTDKKNKTEVQKNVNQSVVTEKNQNSGVTSFGKGRGIEERKTSNVSLSELANHHRSNLHSIGGLKIDSKPTKIESSKSSDQHHLCLKTSNCVNHTKQTYSVNSAERSLDKLSLLSCLKISKQNTDVVVNEQSAKGSDLLNSDLNELNSLEIVKAEVFRIPSRPVSKADFSLISEPSKPGFVLGQAGNDVKMTTCKVGIKRKVKYPSFLCHKQVKKMKTIYPDKNMHHITAFDFFTLSPDDIVKNKQKRAFVRSDKNFMVGFNSTS